MDKKMLKQALTKLDPKDFGKVQQIIQIFKEAHEVCDRAPFQSAEETDRQLTEKRDALRSLLNDLEDEPMPVAPVSEMIH